MRSPHVGAEPGGIGRDPARLHSGDRCAVAAAKHAAAPTPAVYFLLHIPRTAGQTIEHHLLEHAEPGSVWLPARRGEPRPRDADRIRAVGGHHIGCSLEKCFAGREIRRAVLLRDPLGVQLSLYNYRMMNHLNKGLGTYSFDLHVRALPRDWMTHWLLHRWLEIPWPRLIAMSAAEKYRRVNETLARFWFVGAHSDCDRLIAALTPDLGVPAEARARNARSQWHKQIYWEPLVLDALSEAKRAALLARHPIDGALWESWRGAGFGAASAIPRPLSAAPSRTVFCADDGARIGFLFARWFQRECRPRLRWGGRPTGVQKADLARDAGEWWRAADLYRRALSDEPRAPAIWVQYGHMLKLCGDLAGAERAYREAARLDPEDADARMELLRIAAMRRGRANAAVMVSENPGSG